MSTLSQRGRTTTINTTSSVPNVMRLRNGSGGGGIGMRHCTTTTNSSGNPSAFKSMSPVVLLRGSRFHGVSVSHINNNRNIDKNNNNTLIQKQHVHHHRRQQPQCYSDNSGGRDDGEDDDGDDDEYDDEPDILLHEDSTGRTLPVGVQCMVPFNDEQYFVCYPMDDPVAFVRAPSSSKSSSSKKNSNRKHKHNANNTTDDEYDEGDLEPIEDQDVIDKLFPNASAVLAETHLQLQNTPFVLTVADFSDAVLHEPDDTFDDGDNSDEDSETTLGDDRDVEIVAEFMADGVCYYVVRPVEEVLIVAKAIGEAKTEFEVLSSNELERVSPVIEEYIDRERQEGAFI